MNPAPPDADGVLGGARVNPAPPKMYYVYLLKSINKGITYIGCASDLEKRIEEHNSGKCFTTKKYFPLRLVYYEGYLSKKDAYAREGKLKQYGSSLQKLKLRLSESLKEGLGEKIS